MAFIEPHPTDNRTNVAIGTMLLGKGLSSPSVLGWAGWFVAGAIGSYLFPPKVHLPDKYSELGMNTAMTGIPIPLVYGTYRCGGNYVWRGAMEAVGVESEGGNSGGGGFCGASSQISNYDYYMRSAIGISEGKVKISRMWKNDQTISIRNHPNITFYEGTTDQVADPTIASYVTNPVPYRSLAYASLDRFLLGQGQPQAPAFTFECHNYPWNTSAGEMPYIRNSNLENVSNDASAPTKGIAHRLDDGTILVVNENEIKIWNSDLTEELENYPISITMYTNKFFFDSFVYENGDGERYVYVVFPNASNKCAVSRFELARLDFPIGTKTVVVDAVNNSSGGRIFYPADKDDGAYFYVVYYTGATQVRIAKISMDLTVQSTTLSTSIPEPGYIYNITGDENYLFIASRYNLTSTDYSLNVIDTITHSIANLGLIVKPIAIDGIYLLLVEETQPSPPTWETSAVGYFYSFDSAGQLTFVKTFSEDDIWEDSAPPSLGQGGDILDYADCIYRKITQTPDGCFLISWSGDCLGSSFGNILSMILDANPSQVFYNAIVDIRGIDSSNLDLTSLADLGDYCWDNRIGVSMYLNSEMGLDLFMRNLIQYCHGIIIQNNDGKFEFKVFRTTDIPDATITEDHIVAGTYEKVNVNLKDRITLPNRLTLKYKDRSRDYVESSFQADHFLAQTQDGSVIEKFIDFPWVSNAEVASLLAYHLLKLYRYDTSVVTTEFMPELLSINVGDLIECNFTTEGFEEQNIRLLDVEEPGIDNGGSIKVTARTEDEFFNTYERYPIGKSLKSKKILGGIPRAVRPMMIEAPSQLVGGDFVLMMTAINLDPSAIGCKFYIATSETGTYRYAGEMNDFPEVAELSEDLGDEFRDNIVDIDTQGYTEAFPAYTLDQQLNRESLSMIFSLAVDEAEPENYEFVNFGRVSTDGTDQRLRDVYRGLYYTVPNEHSTGDYMMILGDGIGAQSKHVKVKLGEFSRGTTFWIKAVSYGINRETQNIDLVDPYSFSYYGYNDVLNEASLPTIARDSTVEPMGSIQVARFWGSPLRIRFLFNKVNPRSGIDAQAFDDWAWDSWDEPANHMLNSGGINVKVELWMYDSSFTRVAVHSTGTPWVEYFDYTQSQMVTDFGSVPSYFYVKFIPRSGSAQRLLGKHIDEFYKFRKFIPV